MSFFHDPLEDQHRYWINLEKGNIDFTIDPKTGRVRNTVYDPNVGSDASLAQASYDPFGRRSGVIEDPQGSPNPLYFPLPLKQAAPPLRYH